MGAEDAKATEKVAGYHLRKEVMSYADDNYVSHWTVYSIHSDPSNA